MSEKPSEERPEQVIEQLHYCQTADLYCLVSGEQNVLFVDTNNMMVRRQLVGYNEEIHDAAWCLGPDKQR